MNKNNKKKGFTLIEIMVVLAISVLIIGVVYTFYNTNNRALSTAEVKSTLQTEGNAIQKELLTIGTQAKGIVAIDGNIGAQYSDAGDVESFTLQVYDDENDHTKTTNYIFKLTGSANKSGAKELKIYKDGAAVKDVTAKSENVKSIEVKPLDLTSASGNPDIKTASGVQVTFNLYIQKGFNKTEYPVTTIVKFRNKDFK